MTYTGRCRVKRMTKKDLERANAAAATLLVTAIGCSRGGAPQVGTEKPAPSHDSATTATTPTTSEAASAASSAPKPEASAPKPEASAPPEGAAAPSATPSAASPGHGPKFIGNATMRPDGTLVLDLTAAGSSGHAQMIYPPSHAEYQEMLRHLGGLRPGQQKLVPAFPDNINDALVEQIGHAYIAEKKGWKREAYRFSIMGTDKDGNVALSVTYLQDVRAPRPTVKQSVSLLVDQKGRRVLKEERIP